jgi:hypothetical protein
MKPVLIQADRRVARSAARQPCVLVTNLNNGRSVHVKINDCGRAWTAILTYRPRRRAV